ncbi:hypothetical protein [Sinorhizobium numidicum]|uniref:hypothetical protein n=1 Tax=Sinorhizobium numidicum TaxID=680248 RepID=UPI003144F47F
MLLAGFGQHGDEISACFRPAISKPRVFGFGRLFVVDKATNSTVGEVGFAHFHRGHGATFDGSPEAMWKIDSASSGKVCDKTLISFPSRGR